jgi:hypothetical protein
MSDSIEAIRRRHAALVAARNGTQLYAAQFEFRANAELDIATLLAEVDRLRGVMAHILDAGLLAESVDFETFQNIRRACSAPVDTSAESR